TGVAWRIT
nr:RecName: Full=Lectin [Ganoderma lucidum]